MENLSQVAQERVAGFQERIDITNKTNISEGTRDAIVAEYQSKIDLIVSNSNK